MADRSVRVRLEAVVNPYVTKMAEAEAATRKLSQAEKDVKKATSDLGRDMQRAGGALALGLTAPLILFAKNAADTAMTAQETANRVTVAFGGAEEALHSWSEDSARSMGLARHEAEGTAATFTTMFQEMGLGAGTSFKLSTGIVQLAADVGSFRDVDPTEMLTKMRAGIIGEYEPLRQLGIVLTDAEVRHEAVRMKLAQTESAVSTAALVQARYSLILQQTSKDQGDYARTADSATNSTRTAQAAYKDAMAELGSHLLPVIAEGAQLVTALAEGFSQLGPAGQTAILIFGGIAATVGPAIFVTGTLIRNLDTIALKAPMAATSLRTLTMAAGGIGLAIGLATTAMALFGNQHQDSKKDIEDFTAALKAEATGVQDVVNQTIGKKLVEKGIDLLANEAGVALSVIGDAIAGDLSAMGEFNKAIREGKANADTWLEKQVFSNLEKDVHGLTGELDDSKDVTIREAQALSDLGAAGSDAAAEVGELKKKLDELYDSTFGAQEAADRFTEDLFSFSDGVRAAQVDGDRFATSLDASTETGRRNRETLRGLVDDLFDYAGSTGASAEQTALMREQLIQVLTQLGFNRTEGEKFTAVLSQLDSTTVTPKVGLDTSEAEEKLSWVERRMRGLGVRGGWPGSDVETDPFGFPVRESSGAPSVAEGVAGEGPEAKAARERQQREREEATRRYLDSLRDAAEERKRLEEATTQYLDALYQHQVEIEDNQYEYGAMSKDRYLEILRERLRGLEQFSNEWMAIIKKISEVEEDALDKELERIRAFEEGRTFERLWMELAPQRLLSDGYMTPAAGGSSTTVYQSSQNWSPTFNAYGSDATTASATNNQKLRDFAAAMG